MVNTRPRRDLEHTEQAKFFGVLRKLKHPAVRFTFAIPNGFLDSSRKRIRAYREGMTAGVWDIFVPFASQGFHGLFLEFKSPTGTLSAEQEEFLNTVRPRGYRMEVVRSYREALLVLQDYLETPRRPDSEDGGTVLIPAPSSNPSEEP